MPDVSNTPYNYAAELLDTGTSGGYVPVDPALSPNQNAKGDDFYSNMNALLQNNNPWLKSLEFTTPYNTKLTDTERYTDPMFGFDPFNPNIETQYGDRQGAWDKWKNNIIKFGANTLGTFVESIATIPNVVSAIANDDLSKIEDNPITNGITEWLDELENDLPNFETSFGKAHPVLNYIPFLGNSGDSLGGVLKNLGFTAGAITGAIVQDIAVGSLTGGAGAAPLVGVQLTKGLGNLGRLFGAGNKSVQSFTKALQAGKTVEQALSTMSTNARMLDKTRYGLSLFTSATAEASIESNKILSDLKRDLNADFYEKHGRDPLGSEMDEINNYAKEGANAGLLANIGLLMFTEANIFGSILKPVGAARASMQASIDDGIRLKLKEGSKDVFEEVVNPKRWLKGFLSGRGLKTMAFEGGQEGGQFAITTGVEDFYKRKYDQPSIDSTDNFVTSLSEGLSSMINTAEGRENILLGAFTGAIINPITKFIEKKTGRYQDKATRVAQVVETLNNAPLTGLFEDKYNGAVVADNLAKAKEDAVKSGDLFEYMNIRHQELFNFVNAGVKTSRFEAQLQRIEDIKSMPLKDKVALLKLEGLNLTEEQVDSHVNGIIAKSLEIKKDVDKVNRAFRNNYNPKTLEYKTFEDYKEQLAIALSKVKDNRRRISSIGIDITSAHPGMDIEKLTNLTNAEGIRQTIKDFHAELDNIASDKEVGLKSPAANKRQAWLEKTIAILEQNLITPNKEEFGNSVNEIINHYKGEDVDTLDAIEMFNAAQDAYRLGLENESLNTYFKKLTDKEGFSAFVQEQRKFIEEIQKKQAAAALPLTSTVVDNPDNEEIDENGRPVAEAKPIEAAPVVAAKVEDEFDKPFDPDAADAAVEEAKTKKGRKKKDNTEQVQKEAVNAELEELRKQGQDIKDGVKTVLISQGNSPEEAETKAQQWLAGTPTGQRIMELESVQVQEEQKNAKPVNPVVLPKNVGKRKYSFNPFVFINKIFSKNYKEGGQEANNLRDAVINMTPKEIYDAATLKVSESTEGLAFGEYKLFPSFPNMYYTGYKYDINMVVDGKVVGKLPNSDRVFFKRGDQFVPISEITKEEYERVTTNSPDTFEDFQQEIKAYKDVLSNIESRFKGGKTEFSNAEVKALFKIAIGYGGVRLSSGASTSTMLGDILYDKPGNVVVSMPMFLDPDQGLYVRAFPEVIGGDRMDAAQREKLDTFLADNSDRLELLNSRYLFIAQMPNGEYTNISAIAARPAAINEADFAALHAKLTQTKITSQDQLDNINADLKERYYIADSKAVKGSGTTMFFSLNLEGDIYLNIINKGIEYVKDGEPKVGYSRRLKIVGGNKALSLPEFINQVNANLFTQKGKDKVLDKLDIVLTKESIKTGILPDESVTYEDLKKQLSVAVQFSDPVTKTTHLLESPSLTIQPLGSKAPAAPVATPASPVAPTAPKAAPTVVTPTALNDALKKLENLQGNFLNVANKGIKNEARNFEAKIGDKSYEAKTIKGLKSMINDDFAKQKAALKGEVIVEAPVVVTTPVATKTSTEVSKSFNKDKDAKAKALAEAKNQSAQEVEDDFFNNLDCK